MADERDSLFTIRVHNRPGVLAKIAGVFHRRGMNIRTLAVVESDEPELSDMTIGVTAPRTALERIGLSIANLVDVVTIDLHDRDEHASAPAGRASWRP